MYTVAELSHNPATVPPFKLGEVATREGAKALLEARGWTIVVMEMDDDHDAADIAASHGRTLSLFVVNKKEI